MHITHFDSFLNPQTYTHDPLNLIVGHREVFALPFIIFTISKSLFDEEPCPQVVVLIMAVFSEILLP
jgi:hypothetical protein